eukprot:155125_1
MTENKAVYGSVQGLTRTETDPTHNRPRGFLYDKVFSVPAAVDSRLSRILPSQFTRAATDETEFIEKRRLLQPIQEIQPTESDEKETEETKLNLFTASLTIMNIFVGLGLLSQPYAIREGGIISMVWLFLITMVAGYTGKLLVRCLSVMDTKEGNAYADIGGLAMGKFGRYTARTFVFCEISIALMVFIVTTWKNLIYLTNIEPEYEYTIIIVISAFAIPTIMILTFHKLAIISFISVFSCVLLMIVIVINLFVNLDLVKDAYHNDRFSIFPSDFESFTLSVGIFLFSYGGHICFLPVHSQMKKKSQQYFEPMVDMTFFFMFMLHSIIAVSGYLPYQNETDVLITQNLLSNTTKFETILASISTALVSISCFCTIAPICGFACSIIEGVIGINNDINTIGGTKILKLRLFRVVIFIVYCVLSWLLMNKIAVAESICGGLFTMFVTYIMPMVFFAILYLKRAKLSKFNYYLLLAVGGIFTVIAVFFGVQSFMAAANPNIRNK